MHVLHHMEFKTEAWNSFTSPLLKLIPAFMHQSQKLRKRERFLGSTAETKAGQGQTGTAWSLLCHLGWTETQFTPGKKASLTKEQEGRHKYLSALTTPRNKNSA